MQDDEIAPVVSRPGVGDQQKGQAVAAAGEGDREGAAAGGVQAGIQRRAGAGFEPA
jgi:hypothetical protein